MGNSCPSLSVLSPPAEVVETLGSRAFKRALDPTPRQVKALQAGCNAVGLSYNKTLALHTQDYLARVGYTLIATWPESADQEDAPPHSRYYLDFRKTGDKLEINKHVYQLEHASSGLSGVITGYINKDGKISRPKKKRMVRVVGYVPPNGADPKKSGDWVRNHVTGKGTPFVQKFRPEVIESYMSVAALTRNNGYNRAEIAFKNFFSGRAKYPKFKGPKDKRSAYVHNQTFASVDEYHVKLGTGPLSSVKLHEGFTKPEGAKVESATYSWDGRRWQVSITCSNVRLSKTGPRQEPLTVAVDLNGKTEDSLYFSDIGAVVAPKPLEKVQKLLRRIQRRASKCVKGSRNQEKLYDRVSRLHARVKAIRADHVHKQSTAVMDRADILVVENLNLAGMARGNSGKGMLDSGHGEFLRQVTYKAVDRSKSVLQVGRWYPSSKNCAGCERAYRDYSSGKKILTCDYLDCSKYGVGVDRSQNAVERLLAEAASGSVVNKTEEVRASAKQAEEKRKDKKTRMDAAREKKKIERCSQTGVQVIDFVDQKSGAVTTPEEKDRK